MDVWVGIFHISALRKAARAKAALAAIHSWWGCMSQMKRREDQKDAYKGLLDFRYLWSALIPVSAKKLFPEES